MLSSLEGSRNVPASDSYSSFSISSVVLTQLSIKKLYFPYTCIEEDEDRQIHSPKANDTNCKSISFGIHTYIRTYSTDNYGFSLTTILKFLLTSLNKFPKQTYRISYLQIHLLQS